MKSVWILWRAVKRWDCAIVGCGAVGGGEGDGEGADIVLCLGSVGRGG